MSLPSLLQEEEGLVTSLCSDTYAKAGRPEPQACEVTYGGHKDAKMHAVCV